MFTIKFRFIWPSGFRGEYLKKSVNNRKTVKTAMTHDLVQAFLKKWWVESDFNLYWYLDTLQVVLLVWLSRRCFVVDETY
jgi:hypothetical protein